MQDTGKSQYGSPLIPNIAGLTNGFRLGWSSEIEAVVAFIGNPVIFEYSSSVK